jgi:AcrR family transcriptional regulator
MCNNIRVPRKYELKRRAERQDETRQRIVDAAIALHTTIGPTATTVKAIAEQAGVERHTVYRHFPDERSLFYACSGCYSERYPLPDWSAWAELPDAERRLRRGFSELYAYYAARGDELGPIMRDTETNRMTREVVTLRMGPQFERMRDVLAEPLQPRGTRVSAAARAGRARLVATIELYLGLNTWRSLAGGLSPAECVDAAVRAVMAQA